MAEQPSPTPPIRQSLHLRQWAIAVLLLLVAFWFRTHRLADVPPGLHDDDVKNILLVEKILDGYLRVYYPENFGHEPLYHWLQALYVGLLGSGYPEIRLLSVGISMAGLALIYALNRRLLGQQVALWTLAWQAVSLWPLFYSRRAIRGILLVPLAALTGYLFTAGLDEGRTPLGRRWVAWTLGGVALAACLYTYAGSRTLPLFFLLMVPVLALLDRKRLRARWQGIALFILIAGMLSAPLVSYLVTHPEERMGQINAPLNALRAGDPRPLVQNSLRALGMFTLLGDPRWRQFVAHRPVFEPLGAVLFYAGIVLALWRVRHPLSAQKWVYSFTLLWLPVALLPAMLSEGAPNFLRPIAVLVVVYAFPALATTALLGWLRRRNRRAGYAATATLIALLGWNAWRTYDGYFNRWPRHPDTRFAYNSTLLDASRYLDRASEVKAAVLSGHFPGDLGPALVGSFLRRDDLEPRWCDLRQALVYPVAPSAQAGSAARHLSTEAYVIEPDYFPIEPTLHGLFLEGAPPVYEHHLEDGTFVFAVYRLGSDRLEARLAVAQDNLVGWSPANVFPAGLPDDWTPVDGPIRFGGKVELLGYEVLGQEPILPSDGITALTYWRVIAPGPADGITFLHLLSPEGAVATGYDGFGAPPNQWIPGDLVVQKHQFTLPDDLGPGEYPLELGWYERDSDVRWLVPLPGQAQTDRLLLHPIQVASDEQR